MAKFSWDKFAGGLAKGIQEQNELDLEEKRINAETEQSKASTAISQSRLAMEQKRLDQSTQEFQAKQRKDQLDSLIDGLAQYSQTLGEGGDPTSSLDMLNMRMPADSQFKSALRDTVGNIVLTNSKGQAFHLTPQQQKMYQDQALLNRVQAATAKYNIDVINARRNTGMPGLAAEAEAVKTKAETANDAQSALTAPTAGAAARAANQAATAEAQNRQKTATWSSRFGAPLINAFGQFLGGNLDAQGKLAQSKARVPEWNAAADAARNRQVVESGGLASRMGGPSRSSIASARNAIPAAIDSLVGKKAAANNAEINVASDRMANALQSLVDSDSDAAREVLLDAREKMADLPAQIEASEDDREKEDLQTELDLYTRLWDQAERTGITESLKSETRRQ
jgi:hypothetical protein